MDVRITKSIRLLLDNADELLAKEKQVKKRGRKPGAAARKARLEIRCRPELLEVLALLQKEGWASTGLSVSDIIHVQIKAIARRDLHNGCSEEMMQKIDALDKEVPTLLQRGL